MARCRTSVAYWASSRWKAAAVHRLSSIAHLFEPGYCQGDGALCGQPFSPGGGEVYSTTEVCYRCGDAAKAIEAAERGR